MPKQKKRSKRDPFNFTPVAMFFIVVGVVFFVLGLFMILYTSFSPVDPGFSYLITIGGAIIILLGYTNLELGLIRKELEK